MSEFFLELFSEEIPSSLQKSLREELLNSFIKEFNEKSISFKKRSSFSTPNRLVILFEGLQKQITLKSEEIKGPNVKAFTFGPFISSDFKVICFCKPSNRITNLLGVENDDLFLNEIDFSLNSLIKLFNNSSLKLFWRDEGISSLNNSKKNSDI